MTGLVRSELLRLRSRKLFWALALITLIGIVAGTTIATLQSRPTEGPANQAYRSDLQVCLQGGFVPEEDLPPGQTLEEFCDEAVRPEDYVDLGLNLADLPDFLKGSAAILIVLGLMIGASSAGADWQTGSITTLLTWEPRRLRVLFVRSMLVAAALFLMTVVLLATLSLLIWAGASLRGTVTGTGGAWLRGVIGTIARVGFAVSLGGLLGLSIAMIGRNTAGALGAAFVYLAVIESLLRGLFPEISPLLLGGNVGIVVDGQPTALADSLVSVERAFVTYAVYVAVLLAAAASLFRARDVT